MSATGWQNLWAAHSAPHEAPAERPLAKDEPQAEWESPTQFFERTAEAPPRRSRPAKGAPDD